MGLQFHPLANLFPLIEGAAFDELVADVRANGVRERIVILDGKVLDGRNRYRAALAAGLIAEWMGLDTLPKPSAKNLTSFGWRQFDHRADGEPLAWVLSKNLHRRHLSDSQRALIAADIARLPAGRPVEWHREPADNPASLPDLSPVERPAPTQAEAAGLLGVSERSVRTARAVTETGAPELVDAVRRGDVAVSAAAEVAKLPVSEQLAILRSADPRAFARVAREKRDEAGAARALQATRKEPDDSLDYFPTPPWATRALLEAAPAIVLHGARVWEPACGEGHIAGVLQEYGALVLSTDVFDYSVDGRSPPGWDRPVDFLGAISDAAKADWIITNPPFGDKLLPFMLKALDRARDGVAMFVRAQSLETVERYTQLYAVRPPTAVMQFVERVPLHKGRWEPEGDTLTMYCWLLWQRGWLAGKPPGLETAYRWIPPGRREALSRPDDVDRFTAHPVLPFAGAVAPPKPHPTEPPAEPLPAFLGLAPFDFADFPEERLP